MALPKILGIETEFGISHVRGGGDPIAGSTALVNAYAARLKGHTRWDFHDESPGRDARGSAPLDARPPMVETHLANTVLTNGARFYVDHAHPEYSSPECSSAIEAVRYDVAGEHVLRRATEAARELYPGAPELAVYKNNSDGKGNSYGCHENYLVDRELPFADLVVAVVPHFITRSLFCGAGKVGYEFAGDDQGHFQLTQRAEFFEEVVGLETTIKRPIVNTRDEPHADPKRYRRLHVILGDANLAQVATWLKLGTTTMVLAMAEDGALPGRALLPANPVRAFQHISGDLSLRAPFDLADGASITALEAQWCLYEAAVTYTDTQGFDAVGGEVDGRAVLERWQATLHGLETDPSSLAGSVDWIAKLRLLEAYRERHQLSWDDARLAAMDLQYHDLRPERSLAARLGLEVLVGDEEAQAAVSEPPRTTRAYFRGRCLEQYPEQIESANWDSLVFDLGTDPLHRVPMMDPLRGTAAHTEALLDRCTTAEQLLRELDA